MKHKIERQHVNIESYVDLLNTIYDQLVARAKRNKTTTEAAVKDYVVKDGGLEKAVGSLQGALTESFAQYLRLVLLNGFDRAKQDCQDKDQEGRRQFFMRFTDRLIELRTSAVSPMPTPLREQLLASLKPLFASHRTFIRASKVDLTSVSDAVSQEIAGLVQSSFWPKLMKANEHNSTAYSVAYRETAQADVAKEKKELLDSVAAGHFVTFCQKLSGLAETFYGNGASNIAHIVKQVVVAYDAFFDEISDALRDWIACCDFGELQYEEAALKVAGELGHALRGVASQLSDHEYNFITYLAQGVAGISFSRREVNPDKMHFFSACYTNLLVLSLSIQTNLFDESLSQFAIQTAADRDQETDAVVRELEEQFFKALRRAQKIQRDGLIVLLACTVVFAPFIALVVKDYQKKKQRLMEYQDQKKRQLQKSLMGMMDSGAKKRRYALEAVTNDSASLSKLGILCPKAQLHHSLGRSWAPSAAGI